MVYRFCYMIFIIYFQNPRSYERTANDAEPKKRPFCNAFTGCGKKRSEKPEPEQTLPETMDDSLGTLLDLNSEPAIEDLTRQIMSEAKLWEAIQEASRELQVQKIGKNKDALSIVFNTQ